MSGLSSILTAVTSSTSAQALVYLMIDFLEGYPRPAVMLSEGSGVVCFNKAAFRIMHPQPGQTIDASIPPDPVRWPRRAAFHVDGLTLYLVVPDKALDAALPDLRAVPPRLAKIARLAIAGCTDQQIAKLTGLTFSTVRTYVRQVYRYLNVHSRVELVKASLAPHEHNALPQDDPIKPWLRRETVTQSAELENTDMDPESE